MIEMIYSQERRLLPDALPTLWPPQRRERYLLADVPIPLSADHRVWPRSNSQENGVEVTITAIGRDRDEVQVRLGIAVPCEVVEPMPNWEKIGYDVCDTTLTSGLLNCGYEAGEKRELRSWTRRLNKAHLFAAVDDAIAFAELSDTRVCEHRPFGVFGVYRLLRSR